MLFFAPASGIYMIVLAFGADFGEPSAVMVATDNFASPEFGMSAKCGRQRHFANFSNGVQERAAFSSATARLMLLGP
jgi:hypothetical protein